ncbi:MAG: hypothetical protein Roseis3KO_01620 [Roseivirga sp.]
MNYSYQAYGLLVQSEFLIQALSPGKSPDKVADLRIITAPITLNGIPYENNGSIKKMTPEGLLLSVKGVASYLISHKNSITVDVFSKKNELAESILLGPVFTAFLIKKEYQVLSGVTLMKNNRTLLLTGISGVGKSSVAAALSMRGYTVLSDQICALKVSNGEVLAMTAKPNLKLWEDCLEQLNLDATQLQKVRKELNKYYYPVLHKNIAGSYPLNAIYELEISPKWGKKLMTIEEDTFQAFKLIGRNTAWKYLHHELGFELNSFKNISSISANVDCKRIARPYALYNLSELTDFIENQILQ